MNRDKTTRQQTLQTLQPSQQRSLRSNTTPPSHQQQKSTNKPKSKKMDTLSAIDQLMKNVDDLEDEINSFEEGESVNYLNNRRDRRVSELKPSMKFEDRFEYESDADDSDWSPSITPESSDNESDMELETDEKLSQKDPEIKTVVAVDKSLKLEKEMEADHESDLDETPPQIKEEKPDDGLPTQEIPATSTKTNSGKKKKKKVVRHIHVHTHIQAAVEKLYMLFHILSTESLTVETLEEVKAVITCRLPFENCRTCSNKIKIKYNQKLYPHIFEIVEFTTGINFMNILETKSAALELLSAKREFLGVATLPLCNFITAFEKPTGRYLHPENDLPDIEYNGFIIIKNPLSNHNTAKIQILLSLGTLEQTKRLIDYQKSSLKIQSFFRSSVERRHKLKDNDFQRSEDQRRPKGKPVVIKENERIKRNYIDGYSSEEKEDTEPVKESPREEYVKPNPEPYEYIPKRKTRNLIVPSWVPLRTVSRVIMKIKRATGLQEAAEQYSGTNDTFMLVASQVGVNAYVRISNLLPSISDQELVRIDETKIQARTFCPQWNYTKEVEIVIDESVYTHWMEQELVLEVYHRVSSGRVEDDRSPKNLKLGIATIPLGRLVTSRSGIQGWYNIYGAESMVGAIELSMNLDEHTLRTIFAERPFKTREEPPYDVYRFTLFVEEIEIPEQSLKQYCPDEWLQKSPMFSCFYHLSYRFYGEKRVESRQYKSSSANKKLSIEYGKEYIKIMDPKFTNQMINEKLPINLYVTYCSDDRQKNQSTKLLGSIYVDMAPLIHKKQESSKRLAFISGKYSIINPDTDNLSGGSMRVKVCCEVLAKDAARRLYNQLTQPDIHEQDELQDIFRDEESSDEEEEEHRPVDHFADLLSEPEMELDEFEAMKRFEPDSHQTQFRELHEALNDETSKESQPKRIRVEIVKTPTPSQSMDHEEFIAYFRKKSPPVEKLVQTEIVEERFLTREEEEEEQYVGDTHSDSALNHLNICIHEGLSIPLISTAYSFKQIVPSAYVKLVEPSDQESSLFRTTFQTHVIPQAHNPRWFFRFRYPLFQQVDRLMFQLWHQTSKNPSELGDILIGECTVDLSGLYYGLQELNGWYSVENKQRESIIAYIHISVAPEKRFSLPMSLPPQPKLLAIEDNWIDCTSNVVFEQPPIPSPIVMDVPPILESSEEEPSEDLMKRLHEEINELEEITKRIVGQLDQ